MNLSLPPPRNIWARSYNRLVLAVLVTVMGMALSACSRSFVRSRPAESLELEVSPRDFRRVGYVEGESCVSRYFIFFRFQSPDPTEAAGNAMRNAPAANFLANRQVTAEERLVVPLIYHQVCLLVEGIAIELYDAKGSKP